ncbi:unnamed protein product [Didymodactylos carnosus]|uniref:Glutamate--cysteine ligase n=1 Tax=Didymodactylos carnosus TaxID=1234261 RepID=A0A8S2DVS8_9BILA|nr:unnamed protein product [Didymodactylos carnosus]CAF3765291.1 unnamed protein product [Didymodactylos carnosus]
MQAHSFFTVYKDVHTADPFRDDFSDYGVPDWQKYVSCKERHIHLDSCLAGWGCCCLQVTFQGQSLRETLVLYDQLIPMTPVMLALSAACPIWRGYLCDVDTRWNALCESADDRTEEEKNNQETFVGLVPIIERYVKEELQGVTESSRENIHRYLELISKRAAGTTATNATWMRQFVSEHPSYKQDSLVTEEIQHDLMWAMQKVANGKEEVESKRP